MNKDLKKAVNSKNGELIIKYLRKVIDEELDANKIKIDGLSNEAIGEETRAVLKSRKFLQEKIKLLTEPEPPKIPNQLY